MYMIHFVYALVEEYFRKKFCSDTIIKLLQCCLVSMDNTLILKSPQINEFRLRFLIRDK